MINGKFSIGDSIFVMCSGCNAESPHLIESVTKLGKISKTRCSGCGAVSTYSRGVKISFELGNSNPAQPYDRTKKYRKGQAMTHSLFGFGEVTAVPEPHKIDVLFGNKTRRLVHAQA